MGKGLPALKYLSRYLYRGVLPDRDIINTTDTEVSFRYTDSETQQKEIKTLPVLTILYGKYCNTLSLKAFGECEITAYAAWRRSGIEAEEDTTVLDDGGQTGLQHY